MTTLSLASPAALPAAVSIPTLYREMWRYAAGSRAWLVLSSAMLVGSQLVKLLVPWLTAQAVDTLQRGGPDAAAACVPKVAAIVAVYLGCWSLHGPGRVIERNVSLRVRRALTDRLYARLAEAPLAWHATHHPADLALRMSQATQALTNFTQSQFIYLQNAVNLAGPLIALWVLSHATGAGALVGLIGVGLTIVAFDRATIRLVETENRAERSRSAALLDCLVNVTTVLSLRLQAPTRRLLARRLEAVMAPLGRSIVLTEWKWCAVDILSVVLTWGLVALYAWRTGSAGGTLMLGGIFMVHQYAQQAGGVIGTLASNLQTFARIRTDYASAVVIEAAPRVRAAAGDAPPAGWRHIDLCDLSYRHPGHGRRAGDEPHPGLSHVSLRLHAGERIALVGASGCGKSTLLRLIAGLTEPTHGHVEIDGVAGLGVRDLRSCATLIPQEAQIFEATLRENVAFDLDHDDARILRAARVASLDTLVAELPLGLDTPIAQGGANLSGGQRQRVSLARGVLAAAGSSVLLLDEPTSALDPVTEAAVHERLHAAFPDACIVASVHRMSLLARFDRVALLDAGQLVDIGTVAELAQRQRRFRDLLGAESSATAVA